MSAGEAKRARPSSAALAITSASGWRPDEKITAREAGMAGHRDDVEVHLQGHEDPAGGRVGEHVGEKVGGVALGDVGVVLPVSRAAGLAAAWDAARGVGRQLLEIQGLGQFLQSHRSRSSFLPGLR